MQIKETSIKDCLVIEPLTFEDQRGKFVKPYHYEALREQGIDFVIREEYFSVSKKHVVRGLHFQTPPRATAKLVTCLEGQLFDAVVDLRRSSPTYLQVFTIELSSENRLLLYIPEGLAHGFCTLSDEAVMLYLSSEMYSAEHDTGIRWNSAGIPWPVTNPVVSEKDAGLPGLDAYKSPFD